MKKAPAKSRGFLDEYLELDVGGLEFGVFI
jgi:hypothetical protein